MAAFRQLYLQCATNASTRTHYGARFPFTHRSAPSKKLPHRWHIFSSSSLSFSLLPMILFRCTFKFRSVFFLYFGQLFVFCIAFVLTSRFFPVDSVQVCSRLSVSLVFIRSFEYNCSRWGFFFIALQFFSAALHLLVFSHWLVSRACFPSHTLFRVHTFTRVSWCHFSALTSFPLHSKTAKQRVQTFLVLLLPFSLLLLLLCCFSFWVDFISLLHSGNKD